MDCFSPSTVTDHQVQFQNQSFRLLQVEVRLGGTFNRKYRAKGLTPKGPAELTFHNAQGDKEMTVAEYYEQQYQILYVET